MRKLILLFFLFVIFIQGSSSGAEPFAVPTYECLGIYWDPPSGGSASNTCQVRYRKQGDATWKQALPLVYFVRTGLGAPYLGAKYRGSIVNLTPNTTYEVELKLATGGDIDTITAATWNDNYPIAEVVELPAMSTTMFTNTKSGTPNGYILYTHKKDSTATIDVNNNAAQCFVVQGSYVIIRGLILKNGRANGILLGIDSNVVIEDCDISGWGQNLIDGYGVEQDAAVRCTMGSVKRITVQRCKMHHPRSSANSWTVYRNITGTNHPQGPQTISFVNGSGNHVFRYNEVYSDTSHYFNDCIGGSTNGSFQGFPNKDTDIYGNFISCGWDDGIEAEGANRNTRIWGNYIESVGNSIAAAVVSIGPYYAWRNVIGKTKWGPNGSTNLSWPNGGPGDFFKGGNTGDETMMGGQIYIFHNTLLQSPAGPYTPSSGCGRGITNLPDRYIYSRNNILNVRTTSEQSISDGNSSCNYDYDLYNGTVAMGEANGKHGTPVYAINTFDTISKKGTFQLAGSSLGFDQGYPIPNFSDGYAGAAPDMGAQEAGSPQMEFGVNAYYTPKPFFYSAEFANAQTGSAFSYKVLFENPLAGTASIAYSKKPSWATASGDTVYGNVTGMARVDTVIAILDVGGTKYDTLILKISISSTGVISSSKNVTGLDFFVNTYSINGRMRFDIGSDMSGTFLIDVYDIRGNKIWGHKEKGHSGINRIKCDKTVFSQGQYFVRLSQGNRQTTNRFVVIK